MPEANIIRSGHDTWTSSAKPGREHGGDNRIRVKAGSDCQHGQFWLPLGDIDGKTVKSGKVRLTVANSIPGLVELTIQPLNGKFFESSTNHNNAPGVRLTPISDTKHPDGDTTYVFDVADYLQGVAAGGPHYGWRVTTDSEDEVNVHSSESDVVVKRPSLELELTDAPGQPYGLSPSTGVVTTPLPVFGFLYTDPDSPILAARVQINGSSDFSDPDYDSGWVPTSVSQLPLADTSYPALTNGTDLFYRLRVKDQDNLVSEWSEPARLAYNALVPTTITSPASGAVTGDPSPRITWVAPDQIAHRVKLVNVDDASDVAADTGWVYSADQDIELDGSKMRDDATYKVIVRTLDSDEREGTAGHPAYSEANALLTFDDDEGVAPVATLTASPQANGPGIQLTWTRALSPDRFLIERDGELIGTVNGSVRTFLDLTAKGRGAEHVYTVKAVEEGQRSALNPEATCVAQPGVWLIDPETGDSVHIQGGTADQFKAAQTVEVVHPLGARTVILRDLGARGYEGSVSGFLSSRDAKRGIKGPDLQTALDFIYKARRKTSKTYRLRVGFINIPVVLAEVTPAPAGNSSELRARVDFKFWQAPEPS